jgi:hypothetical protein
MLALMFHCLKSKFTVTTVKNKYLQEAYDQPPDLHVNFELRDGWICEAQFLLRDILTVKKELHKFYGIARAENPAAVLENPAFIDKIRERVENDAAVKKLREEAATSRGMFKAFNAKMKQKDTELAALRREVEELRATVTTRV